MIIQGHGRLVKEWRGWAESCIGCHQNWRGEHRRVPGLGGGASGAVLGGVVLDTLLGGYGTSRVQLHPLGKGKEPMYSEHFCSLYVFQDCHIFL